MRVRRIVTNPNTNKTSVIWFGSSGANVDGTANFYNKNDKHDNFSSENTMIKDSLMQKLNVIRHELWYDYQYGMPLVDNDATKVTVDAFVMKTIQNHEDVIEIVSFKSWLDKHTYHCDVQFTTTFGSISLSI